MVTNDLKYTKIFKILENNLVHFMTLAESTQTTDALSEAATSSYPLYPSKPISITLLYIGVLVFLRWEGIQESAPQ